MELEVWDSRVPATQETTISSNDSTPGRTRVKLTPDNYRDILCYQEEFQVIICRFHCTAVVNLDTHLRDQHKTPIVLRKVIVEYFSQFSQVAPEAVELPEQPACVIEELGAPLDGLKCKTCGLITVNTDVMRMHCKKNHQQPWKGSKSTLYEDVKVQSFYRTGGLQKYFIVEVGLGVNCENIDNDGIVRQQLKAYHQVRQQLEDDLLVLGDTAKTDRTNWFNRTGWPEHLKKRNLAHLAHQIRLPDRDEVKLQLAAELTEKLIERCVKHLALLPRELRRWLRSAKQSEPDVRPLARLQNPDSQATYTSYIVRFVCYYLRLVQDEEQREGQEGEGEEGEEEEGEEEEGEEEEGEGEGEDSESSSVPRRTVQQVRKVDRIKDARELFPWKDNQKALAKELWSALEGGGEEPLELLLQSLGSFLFTSTRNNVFSSGWVHYLAVLGIDVEMGRLRAAKHYSYMLAGMVYCGRVIAAAVLLPTAGSGTETDEDYEHFLAMRRKYIADGSLSPMSESISLLAYGKHIALNQGNAGNAYWSADKKMYYLNGRPIVVERFRKMAQDLVHEVTEQLWGLMWVDRVEDRVRVDLAQVEDDLSYTKLGKSFVTRAGNELSHGLNWMLTQARNSRGGMRLQTLDGRWREKKVRRYLRQVDQVLELLLMSIHVTSGQPARGSEVTTIRHRNGQLQDRNVYVVDGQVMTVVRYHKSHSQWDKPKVVPRFLPAELGQAMVVYLAYLQPFREYLVVEALGGGLSDYVWSNEHGAWHTDRLTRVIKRETGKRLGVPLHTQGYRHAAVGIGREKVGESFGRGYQDEIGEVDEAEVEDDKEDIIELQNSRTTAVGVGNYSVPIDIVKHLSIRAIDAFRELSTAWHRFLGVDGSTERTKGAGEHVGQDRAKKRPLRESISSVMPLRRGKEVRVEDARATAVHRALQQVLGKEDVGFRSAEQEQALYAVLDNQSPLVVVLPTGGGKSLLFTLPACIEKDGVTIVVVPYRALITDLVARIRKAGVDCIEWLGAESDPASVWVVSADKAGVAGNGNFLGEAQKLRAKGLLRRVVVDEAHLVFTARHWRDKMLTVKNLRVLGCPIVLLTATLPPLREGDLESSLLVRHATYIRASTVRPNMQYFVQWCARDQLQSIALSECRRWATRLQKKRQKGVVYCLGKQETEDMARELGCLHYHADVEERTEQLEAWIEQGGLVVATSALGTGVDIAGIVYVVHVGMPWSMTDFVQASGRGGRAGERVEVAVLAERKRVEQRMQQEAEDIEVQAMGQFLVGSGCRRLLMSSYMDRVGVSCGEIGAVRCDRCGEGEGEWLAAQEEWAREWEVVERTLNELRQGCALCWVFAQEQWREHRTMQCMAQFSVQRRSSGAEADCFRQKIKDRIGRNNCRRCWVSQKYCATGEGRENRCQWPNVVVPVVFAARMTVGGKSKIREMGFKGRDDDSYAKWLGGRYDEEVWGQVFSNAMALAIWIIVDSQQEGRVI